MNLLLPHQLFGLVKGKVHNIQNNESAWIIIKHLTIFECHEYIARVGIIPLFPTHLAWEGNYMILLYDSWNKNDFGQLLCL